jgi:hypothetical protein
LRNTDINFNLKKIRWQAYCKIVRFNLNVERQ